jgi:hypothetical protein
LTGKKISEKSLKLLLAFVCILATVVCNFTVLSQTTEGAELPEFFENMIVRYDCSANVKTPSGSLVFNITCQCIYTVEEVNGNASIEQIFKVISMNGVLPVEVSKVFFLFPLESQNATIEVPIAQLTQSHYWNIFLDDALLTWYKEEGRFIGEENFETLFAKVGTYHVRNVEAYNTYDVFYDKATGWVVYLKETYGGGKIPNYKVAYSIEITETNATLSPPIPSEFPYHYLLILAIPIAIVAASVFLFRKKRQIKHKDLT